MAQLWDRKRVIEQLRGETLSGLESGFIEPLLTELRSVARRFDLLAEGCRQSGNPDLRGMVQTLELASGMVDDLLDEALDTSLRRAIEDVSWAQPQDLGGTEEQGSSTGEEEQ